MTSIDGLASVLLIRDGEADMTLAAFPTGMSSSISNSPNRADAGGADGAICAIAAWLTPSSSSLAWLPESKPVSSSSWSSTHVADGVPTEMSSEVASPIVVAIPIA